MSLTVEGVVVQALTRAYLVTRNVPGTRSVAYRRIGIRQQEVFAMADKVNHEYNGVSAVAGLAGGAADLATITDPVPVPEELTQVRIEDKGSSTVWSNGQIVRLVAVADPWAAIPPRMTLRNRLLVGVGTDLTGVASIRIFYVFRPPVYCPTDDCEVVALHSPYDDLLVLDLARWLLNRSPELPSEFVQKAIADITSEESQLLAAYLAHVRAYSPIESRYDGPPEGNTPRSPVIGTPAGASPAPAA